METINDFKGLLVYTKSYKYYGNNDIINITDNAPDVSDYVILDVTSSKPSASEVLSVAKAIYQRKSEARFWIGTPKYDMNTQPVYNFIKGSIEEIKNVFMADTTGRTIWNNCVKGVYLNMERIYDKITYSASVDQNNTKSFLIAKNLSNYVHNTLDLNLLWIPYYGYGSDPETVIKDLAYMVARTNIFDIVIIQPRYYFDDDFTPDNVLVKNLDAVKYSVNCNNICYRDGNEVFTRTCYNAKVGFEMEVDNSVVRPIKQDNEKDIDFQKRLDAQKEKRAKYEKYVSTFKTFRNNNSVPKCFYAGNINDIKNKYILIEDIYGIPYGDANNDGRITANDAAIVLQYALNGLIPDELVRVCDVDGNGTITANDAACIQQKSLDASYDFPIIERVFNPEES